MNFSLTEDQELLRDSIVRFAKEELGKDVMERDRTETFSREEWLKCAELGLQGAPVPAEFGGAELDELSCAVALEALGYGCRDNGLVFSLCAHLLSCVVPIAKYGSEEQKQAYLPKLCDGSWIGVHAMTEPHSGSDAFALSARAEPDGDGYRLNGTKTFISNGPVADLVIIFALTDANKGYHGGVTAFVTETKVDGFRAGQKFEKMGLRTSPLGELIFTDLYVPSENILGGVGMGSTLFNTAMDWERVLLFASHLGMIERLIEETSDYARTRKQFGQTISKFQAVSHRLVDLRTRFEAARLLTFRSASRLATARTVSMDAAMTKLLVSELFVDTAMAAVQIFGGNGYMTEYGVERSLRDALGSTIYSGTSEMQRNIVARWLGL